MSEPGLTKAVDRTSFQRLVAEEAEHGFRETAPTATTFFRRGHAHPWREELSTELITHVVADNNDMMNRLGYLPSHPDHNPSTNE